MSVLDRYRANWPRVGGVMAMAAAGTLAMTHRRMPKPQLLSALNMLALLVHQYEEYEDPGYFPGQFNGGIFHSDQPDRYPLNSPGFLASLLLHVPIGIQYLRALGDEAPIKPADMRKAVPYTIVFAASSIAAPNVLLRDKNSPYRFTAKQVGHHTGGR
jgi:hypothetical protein